MSDPARAEGAYERCLLLAVWFSPRVIASEALRPLLVPFAASAMSAYPVSTKPNSAPSDDPTLIEPDRSRLLHWLRSWRTSRRCVR
ncbi:MAG: hypothetical protein ACRECD_15050 [Burkholderiaceae bacterium]